MLPPVQYRLRVRVCYWQRQNTVVPNARIQVDHNNMPAPGGDNYADCGLFNAGMRTITVLRSAANPLPFVPRVDEQINLQNDQDLDVYVDQCVRVPLGIQTNLPFVETVDDTWIRFWTPTVVGSGAAGGHCMFLRCERDAGTETYHDGNPYAAGNREDDWFFPPPGAAGWRYFKSEGAAQVTITLLERAWAREAQDTASQPIVPWNFYFWSASSVMPANPNTPVAFLTAGDPGNASGYSPFERFDVHFATGGAAFAWESNPAHITHNDLGLAAPNNSWVGHCDYMVRASIVLDTPAAAHGFDVEELKLLAAEFAANHVQPGTVWQLSNYNPPLETMSRFPSSEWSLLAERRGNQSGRLWGPWPRAIWPRFGCIWAGKAILFYATCARPAIYKICAEVPTKCGTRRSFSIPLRSPNIQTRERMGESCGNRRIYVFQSKSAPMPTESCPPPHWPPLS